MADNQYTAYGTIPQNLEAGDVKGSNIILSPPGVARKRVRMNVVAIFVSLFVPWALFSLLFAVVSFRLHYKLPIVCWTLVALGIATALSFGALAYLNVNQLVKGSPDYQPTWYIFLSVTSLAAVVLGPVLGNTNFWQNMQPYYDLVNLAEYNIVDPTRMRGEQMMDAGQVTFLPGAMLDLKRAYAFQNVDTYCVAPITVYNPGMGEATPLASYDFWAVGLNCCGGNSTQTFRFECGPVTSPTAHQGLRLMVDVQRAFFRLAVQQAESAHMIKSDHPLFFHWTENATTDMKSFLADAFRTLTGWMCGWFAVQLCLVLALTYIKSKAGFGNL